MSESNQSDSTSAGFHSQFESVASAERAWIAERRRASGLPTEAPERMGLAFSGGGIRSAVFNLGVLEALEAKQCMREVDYLSTVSGGGYIGASYSWLRHVLGPKTTDSFNEPVADRSGTVVDWLRAHGMYLIAQRGFSFATLLAAILTALVLNVLVFTPLLVIGIDWLTLNFISLDWPRLAHWFPHPPAHDGFLLLVITGLGLLLLWPVFMLGFAVVARQNHHAMNSAVDRYRVFLGWVPMLAMMLLAIGSIPVIAMLLNRGLAEWMPKTLHGLGPHLASLGAAASGALAFWRSQKNNSVNTERLAFVALALLVYAIFVGAYVLAEQVEFYQLPHGPVFAALLLLSIVIGTVCDLNALSIHAYYRDRLQHAFQPSLAQAPSVTSAKLRMDDLQPSSGQPFHLVCSTLNTSTSPNERRRHREGDCFSFSPLFFGSGATGWRAAKDNANSNADLITAATIAGAAVDPNTPQTARRSLSFLMALLNLRLGYWGLNPNPAAKRAWPLPAWWIRIFRELSGTRLDERWRDIHLSDGGQFENLGLYELARRGVENIICVDAGCDPNHHFTDLGNAIEKIRVDFGAQIDLKIDPSQPVRPWYVGSIVYADGRKGAMVYFKPCLHGAVSADVLAYQHAHPSFPNESTANQFYTEPQFEAYRWLAKETVLAALNQTGATNLSEFFKRAKFNA